MRTKTRNRLWRMPLLISLAFAVYGCESQDLPEPPPEPVAEGDSPREKPPAAPFEAKTKNSALLIRIPMRSRERLPENARGIFKLSGTGAQESQVYQQEVDPSEDQVLFANIRPGRYQLLITYLRNETEIGSYDYPVDIGARIRDVTAPIEFVRRGKVVVSTSIDLTFNQIYEGMAHVVANGCTSDAEPKLLPAQTHIDIMGEDVKMTLTLIPGEEFALTGSRQAAGESRLFTGRYSSSADSSGNWALTDMRAPSPASLWLSLELRDERDDCQRQVSFTGLVDGPGRAVIGEVPEAEITVELVGQGQTHSVQLLPGQSEAVFDELLIGPYDVFVDLSNNGQLADAYRNSVTLADEDVRLTAGFDRPLPLMGIPRLPTIESYDRLTGSYQGKSLVSQGRPGCVGSIALVDSTALNLEAAGATLALEFDNFYGRVLNLTGRPSDTVNSPRASGNYSSSDQKVGTWAIHQLSASDIGQLAVQVAFDNQTDGCEVVYEFLGLRE